MPARAAVKKRVVFRLVFLGRIDPIGQESKMQMPAGITEVVNFKPLKIFLNGRAIRE